MSMLDAFLNKGFKGSRCKTLLKLTIPRIKLLRNRREIQMRQMRKDIAKLLEAGQEATARIRVEHIIREENMMAAQEIIELFCELISVRLPIIESQRECPLDLKEAISSICFAAPRCADLPELLQVQLAFASKYGKEFVAAASELMPDCGVNRQLVELLSVRAPSPEKKMKLLKEIAEEHELDWDPAPSETELFKSHEDLLNGPTQFVSGSKVPLPKQNDELLQSTSAHGAGEHSESEEDFNDLEFPEVPTGPLKSTVQPSAPHPEEPELFHASENFESEKSVDQSKFVSDTLQADPHEPPVSSFHPELSKQFVPLIVPALPIEPPSLRTASADSTKPLVNRETSDQFEPFVIPHQTQPGPPEPLYSPSPAASSNHLRTQTYSNIDLNDVLAAAKSAAESAERAAAAARSAASLAELRISEICRSNSGPVPENNGSEFKTGSSFDKSLDNPFHASNSNLSTEMENLHVDDNRWSENKQTANGSSYENDNVTALETSSPNDNLFKPEFPSHQPQSIPSMEDESVFTYPNLFSSPDGHRPSSDNSPPR